MALSECTSLTDIHDRELAEHGSIAFPIAAYHDDLGVSQVPWHWHEEWEFAIVTEGAPRVLLENQHVVIQPGDGIFINTKALHGVDGTGWIHSAVFHQRLIGGNADSVFWQKNVQPLMGNEDIRYILLHKNIPWEAEVLREFETTWQCMNTEPEDFENEVRYHLSKAIGILMKNCDFDEGKLSEQELLEAQRIRVMLTWIEENYKEDMTVDDISKTISASESAVLRCFKKTLGTSPMQYVKQYRIRKAAELLETTQLTARDAALECGFNDVSYFTKTFRQMYGCTPGQYKKAKEKHSS